MKPPLIIAKPIVALALLSFLSACSPLAQRQNSGTVTGAVIGTLLGAGAGVGIAAATTHGSLNRSDAAGIGILAGAVIGAGIGYLVGDDSKQLPKG